MRTEFGKDPFNTHLKEAAALLKSGGLVAYPTESFYGLAADAANETAIHRLFQVKGRKPSEPVLLLIPDVGSLKRCVAHVPEAAKTAHGRILAGRFNHCI